MSGFAKFSNGQIWTYLKIFFFGVSKNICILGVSIPGRSILVIGTAEKCAKYFIQLKRAFMIKSFIALLSYSISIKTI